MKASATGTLAAQVASPLHAPGTSGADDRAYWIRVLTRIADPVLLALSARKLKATMPVEAPHGNETDRRQYTYLEALGRLLAGLSPWIESGEGGHEGEMRTHYAELSRQAIAAAVDPSSPDYMNFDKGSQPVVDAAFLHWACCARRRNCGKSFLRKQSGNW